MPNRPLIIAMAITIGALLISLLLEVDRNDKLQSELDQCKAYPKKCAAATVEILEKGKSKISLEGCE